MKDFIEYAPGMFARPGERRVIDGVEWTFYPDQVGDMPRGMPVAAGWISRKGMVVGGRIVPPELRSRAVNKSKAFTVGWAER